MKYSLSYRSRPYGEAAVPYFTRLCNQIWQTHTVPAEWRNGIIFHCLKKAIWFVKMRQLAWNNIAVGARENLCQCSIRQNKEGFNDLRQEQAGFRPGRSCNDQIFALRQILKTVTAGCNPTTFNFIDFRKAFDSVHWPALWKILRMYGFPEQIISILQNLYQDSKCAVRTNGDTSEWFTVLTGVRQGCILSPLLFAIVMDWVHHHHHHHHHQLLQTHVRRTCLRDKNITNEIHK